jgi:DNA invertase Pin-like site-specific DNA recombinase
MREAAVDSRAFEVQQNSAAKAYTIRYSVQTKTGVTHMQEKTERNAEIVEMRKAMSVDEIAEKLGLNRQRIYQILRRAKARAE